MINFEKIRKLIKSWQTKYDNDFKILPNDNHSYLIFNHKNEIIKFIFSDENKRNECILSINELLNDYDLVIEQEDGLTYYYFN